MKRLFILAALGLLGVATGCSSSDNVTNVTSCQPAPFKTGTAQVPAVAQPCTVAVNFSMDDTANKTFLNEEAQWKGSFRYDPITRIAYHDSSWTGPYVPLWDDGPWTTGGHEPVGEVAGDHIFGATIFVFLPEAQQTWEYGLIDHKFGDGWIWRGQNGSFVVQPTTATAIDAAGIALLPFGTTDLRLELDTAALLPRPQPDPPVDPPLTWDTSAITVKGLPWAWQEVPMYDDGTHGDTTASDGVWTFRLSDWVGAGNTFYHYGLLSPNSDNPFVFVFADGKEYQAPTPPVEGVSAFLMAEGTVDWVSTTVLTQATGDKNTYVHVP